MNKVFFGFLFIFLDINLKFNAHSLNLLPDWVGYILVIYGLNELWGESERFTKAKPLCVAMAIYTGVLWLLDIFAVSVEYGGFVGWAVALVPMVISFYISYLVVLGVGDIEANRGIDLQYERLMKVWKVHAISTLATYILMVIPPLAVISLIVCFVAAVVFLVFFNGTRQAYNRTFGYSR
ncbi:MAG: hypothetical protein IKZ82_08115 [Clostridia bacterium]|nr:hypothetical protein [Clostridia bacterium]